jgi:hypothetical protein
MRDLDNFIDWLKALDTQTLTDELKEEIIIKVEDLADECKAEGFTQACHTMMNFIMHDI